MDGQMKPNLWFKTFKRHGQVVWRLDLFQALLDHRGQGIAGLFGRRVIAMNLDPCVVCFRCQKWYNQIELMISKMEQ